MKKQYSQLNSGQRYQIQALHSAGHTQTAIAEILGFNKSTISREFQRNIPKRGIGAKVYAAKNAQDKTNFRHRNKHKFTKFTEALKIDVRRYLEREKYSPELISAQWRKDSKPGVCHETIYKWIWQCKRDNHQSNFENKKLYKLLKHGKRRRKRGNYQDSRGLILHRVSIDQRPKIVNKRKRLGDIEVDLIIGKGHKSGLLIMLDRATLVTTIDKIKSKKSKHIKDLILKRMKNNIHLKTLTFDNDQAFGLHYEIAKELKVKTFFTRPYTSQDKGSVENRNGVIRRFYPKKTDFNEVSTSNIRSVEKMINNRPIRKFNYLSANEVLFLKSDVALIG